MFIAKPRSNADPQTDQVSIRKTCSLRPAYVCETARHVWVILGGSLCAGYVAVYTREEVALQSLTDAIKELYVRHGRCRSLLPFSAQL